MVVFIYMSKKMLGIDFGSKKIGIAISDSNCVFAFPHETVKNDSFVLNKIKNIIKNENIATVVVGESLDLSGRKNTIMEEISKFKESLEREVGADVVFEPEFFTTAQAIRIQGRTEKTDASAAAFILQSYLDKIKNKEGKKEDYNEYEYE